MKGERMAKRSSFGSMVRRRLSDITNSQPQTKLSSKEVKMLPQISPATEDFVNQLIKEKIAMMKLIEERNKIIELSAMEVHNLKGSLQKLQMQNWNLAQSNSQMLAVCSLYYIMFNCAISAASASSCLYAEYGMQWLVEEA